MILTKIRFYRLFPIIFLLSFHTNAQDYVSIPLKEKEVKDTFFNEFIVKDNYRWVEDTNNEELNKWIKKQNKLSKKYLSKTKRKTSSFTSIDEYAYTKYDNPRKEGDYYFTHAYYDEIGAPALFYKKHLKFSSEILVDPNFISNRDKIRIKGYWVSGNSELLAYQFSRNGSDWAELKVISLKSKLHKDDHLKNLKFSNIAWKGNGFFYSTFPRESKFGKVKRQKVYYHKVGTPQSEDKLVFKRNNPYMEFEYTTTSNERFFILKEINDKAGKINVFYIDYQSSNPSIKPLFMNISYDINIIDSHKGKFIATTSYKANNGRIIEIDPKNPFVWNEIAPNYKEALLLEVKPLQDKIITIYDQSQYPIITVYDYQGKVLYNMQMDIPSTVSGFSGEPDDKELLFNMASYTIPPVVFKFNVDTYQRKLMKRTSVTFDYENIVYDKLEYPIDEKEKASVVLVHKKGIERDGSNPVLLNAYGGFGIVAKPMFDPGIVHFIEEGGIYAFASIRGGGDKGAKWAWEGRGRNKENSFNDFISAAEFLIDSGYTCPEKIAAKGGSNGGLVVAAAGIKRPDLFKVIVPVAAPLDMLRLEKYTVGPYHTDEYGSVKDSVGFFNLYNYSPYHNIHDEVNYPNMLIITAKNDERVPPFHSYKFAAKLQNRESQKNSILLRVKAKSGHYSTNNFISSIREKAHIYGFILYHLNQN